MQSRIDWLSFTGKRSVGEGDTEASALKDAISFLDDINPIILDALDWGDDWKWEKGRTPYRAAWRRGDNGVSIYVHPRLDHFLVEVSGRGCEALSDSPHAYEFLKAVADRLTRLDLACDMLSDTNPLDFVAQRDEGRFKSHSEFVSDSGTTCYIGSRTSNRYARVYRYNPPHERAHLLRCEFVVKSEDAKMTAKAILETDHYRVASTLGEQYGWRHPDWQPDAPSIEELKAYRPERREGKTLFWLADTVAPLLVRLSQEGTIDAEQWFKENVLRFLAKTDNL